MLEFGNDSIMAVDGTVAFLKCLELEVLLFTFIYILGNLLINHMIIWKHGPLFLPKISTLLNPWGEGGHSNKMFTLVYLMHS